MKPPLVLEFPWPPRQLFPNFKRSHHWSRYRKPAHAARQLGWGLTLQAASGQARTWPDLFKDKPVLVELEYTPPMRGGPVPDEDNLLGALKHYLDGIAAALGVDDAKFTFAQPVWHTKAGAGKVVIRI